VAELKKVDFPTLALPIKPIIIMAATFGLAHIPH
jgi:hypothetical protein